MSEEILYLVAEDGIHRHRIFGIFDNLDDAKVLALNLIMKHDHDGYHDSSVYSALTGTPIDDLDYIGSYRKKHISDYGDDPYKEREIKWIPPND